MKKYVILGIVVLVCWLGFSYHKQQQISQGEELVASAYYGDLLGVKDRVEQGAPLGYQCTFDDEERQYVNQTFNALHAAASGGNGRVVEFLLQAGLDMNVRTPEGWTPLYVAARDGQAGAAKWLVFKGADLNAQSNLGATALTMVVTQPFETEKARLELLEYMLRRGADVNLADKYGHTPLYYAKVQGKQEMVELLERYASKKKE